MHKNTNYICIFDCESIPDAKLIRNISNIDGNDEEVTKIYIEKYKEENNSEFLPLPFHMIISICAVICDEFGKIIKINKIDGDDEYLMIKNFFDFINKYQPRLVSFNGKNYDMPLLVLRALKYNIKVDSYLDTSDKWNNYKTRFNEQKHCDLFESLGATRGIKLDLICAMLDLPGKYDIKGDKVTKLYYENNLEKIHEYCESDTLNTYMLFLKYEFIKGNIEEDDYVLYLNTMSDYIKTHKANRNYIDIFVKACEDEINKIKQYH